MALYGPAKFKRNFRESSTSTAFSLGSIVDEIITGPEGLSALDKYTVLDSNVSDFFSGPEMKIIRAWDKKKTPLENYTGAFNNEVTRKALAGDDKAIQKIAPRLILLEAAGEALLKNKDKIYLDNITDEKKGPVFSNSKFKGGPKNALATIKESVKTFQLVNLPQGDRYNQLIGITLFLVGTKLYRCKFMADMVIVDHVNRKIWIIDLKTGQPRTFAANAIKKNYAQYIWQQASFYTQLFRQIQQTDNVFYYQGTEISVPTDYEVGFHILGLNYKFAYEKGLPVPIVDSCFMPVAENDIVKGCTGGYRATEVDGTSDELGVFYTEKEVEDGSKNALLKRQFLTKYEQGWKSTISKFGDEYITH